ncbi:MAG: recombination mediator protein UvsY [Candidatus Bathyarchaeia archaeon]
MKLEEIYAEWNADCEIDKTELGEESIRIPKLHNKYYKVYTSERLLLRKLEADMKQLKLAKHEFYSQGPSKEQIDAGWQLPPKGLILKTDLPMYIDADKEIIELSLKIGYQQEKIDLLESIIKSFTGRGFQIKAAIEWARWTGGG